MIMLSEMSFLYLLEKNATVTAARLLLKLLKQNSYYWHVWVDADGMHNATFL